MVHIPYGNGFIAYEEGGAAVLRSRVDGLRADRDGGDIVRAAMEKTLPDQWESQILARILMKHHVIFVTRPELKGMVEDMKMSCAPSLPQAVAMARTWGGESITVIPNGVSVIVG